MEKIDEFALSSKVGACLVSEIYLESRGKKKHLVNDMFSMVFFRYSEMLKIALIRDKPKGI